ncbi:alanyl-tRNA editing protein [Halorubrum lipolyticum]|uniref:Threonyl/alanyl tRNA synthetase SAD n=1 Tax=Halorubrum lipolyticum DSM 21995 TaxID=1227482 RepID=M0P005_9EURY|nr:alanyl-tRNA editing protein [Halorubrum lipolyticum]EMA63143.1 threonyl/alanyl tRNA synthetase SAD [Halorubrum lipolyticum DSM 21995]
MTEALYLADDTVTTFEATVERALDDRVVLDRTHFYPTGGGQPHDTGTLRVADDRAGVDDDGDEDAGEDDSAAPRGWRVVDVQKKDTVYHTLEPIASGADTVSPPEPGTRVVGEIDAARRRAHSRYHTAQHLLSALLLAEFDARTTGNQLHDDHAHLDAAYDRFDDGDLARIEARLNELVADERPVRSYVMDREEAEATLDTDRTRIDLLPDSIAELRIVEIGAAEGADVDDGDEEPYDRTACAGTHVGDTAEIGEIVVTGRETKGSDEERVRFALADHVADDG